MGANGSGRSSRAKEPDLGAEHPPSTNPGVGWARQTLHPYPHPEHPNRDGWTPPQPGLSPRPSGTTQGAGNASEPSPLMSKKSSAITGGPLSMGLAEPLKTRPARRQLLGPPPKAAAGLGAHPAPRPPLESKAEGLGFTRTTPQRAGGTRGGLPPLGKWLPPEKTPRHGEHPWVPEDILAARGAPEQAGVPVMGDCGGGAGDLAPWGGLQEPPRRGTRCSRGVGTECGTRGLGDTAAPGAGGPQHRSPETPPPSGPPSITSHTVGG